jgi:hypothetical protein
MVSGIVEDFDEQRGDGRLRDGEGHEYYFHCVSIANGTRSIPLGVRAHAQRAVGRLGHDEVVDIIVAA